MQFLKYKTLTETTLVTNLNYIVSVDHILPLKGTDEEYQLVIKKVSGNVGKSLSKDEYDRILKVLSHITI